MPRFCLSTLVVLASATALGCKSIDATLVAAPPSASATAISSPQERAVHDAMAELKQAVIDSDTITLKRLWSDDYNFINTRGALVTRAQRLANFASGATDISVIDNEREITMSVYGDMVVLQNLSTLHGQFAGQPANTDLRGMFIWIHREGRWQLVSNELTAVVP